MDTTRSAFDRARDRDAAWRAQQAALLTEAQRARLATIKAEEERRRKERARQLQESRSERINEEKRRLLLEHQNLALRLLPAPRLKTRIALARAIHTIEQRDRQTLATLAQEALTRTDDYLREVADEQQRERLTRAFAARASRNREARERGGPTHSPDLGP